MSKNTALHPSVQQFKKFVKKHPLLVKEVKEGRKTWQYLYEEWTILGEKDKMWEKYRKEKEEEDVTVVESTEDASNDSSEKKESSQGLDLIGILKNINLNDIQQHIQNFSGIMGTVQGLLQTFQSKNPPNQQPTTQNRPNQQPPMNHQHGPFNFRDF